jgi:hypothetical protein
MNDTLPRSLKAKQPTLALACLYIPSIAGVIGAAVMPVVGVGVGVVQIVRGVINTGEAIRQSSNNKIWDDVRVCMCVYY